MSITDKELLTFCNLTNLKMEYADLGKERDRNTGEIKVYHTIYSLLENEVIGIENRENLKKQFNITALEEMNYEHNDEFDTEEKESYLDKKEHYQKILNEEKEQEFGIFYKTSKDNTKQYFYDGKKDLRSKAPIVMEYFDRYNISNNQSNHEGAFLKEWEVIQAFDSYNLGKYLFIAEKERQYKELEKSNIILEKSFEGFPTRLDIENKKIKQMLFTIIKYAYTGISNIQLGATPIPAVNDFSFSGIVSTGIKKISSKENIKDFFSFVIGFSSMETAPLKKGMERAINSVLEESYDIKIKAQNTETVEEIISLEDEILKFIILRKKGTNTYVVSIYNHKDLSSITELREEKLPKYIFNILRGIQNILNDENKITFTGIGNAGILANILNIYLTSHDSKGFYLENPSLISLVANFTPKDIGYLSTFDYMHSTYSIEQLYGIATILFGITTSNPLLSLPIWWMYTVYGLRAEKLNVENKNKEIEKIYQKLIKMEIIKNVPKKTIVTTNDSLGKEKIEWNEYDLENSQRDSEQNLEEKSNEWFEHGLENHNKNLILGEINKEKLEVRFPLEIKLKDDVKNIFNEFRKEYSFVSMKLEVKIREHIIFNLLEESGHNIVAFDGETVIFNKDFDFITFNVKEDIYRVLKKKKYYIVEERKIYGISEAAKNYTWKEVDYLDSKQKKGYPENKLKNLYTLKFTESDLIDNVLIEELPNIDNNKNLLRQELLQGRGYRFFTLDNSGIITTGMIINNQLEQLSRIQNYLKDNKNNKSYGAYLEKIGNNYDIKLECKYLSPKENKLLRKDNSSLQIEYLFFPFLSKEGMLTTNLREEYICNCIKSVIAERYEPNKCLDWNCDSEIGYQRNKPQFSEREARKWIIESLEKVRNETQIFPFINLVVRNLDENKLKEYSKLQEDANGNPEMILGITDGNNKHLKDEIGFIYNPFDQITGKELTLYLRKMSEKEKNEPLEPTASPIVDGVILECNCGTSPTPLKVTSQSNLSMRGKFTVTEKDNIPNINILPFGNCKNLPYNPPCPLAITGKWENTSNKFTIKDIPVLLDCSSMKCTLGGEIKPKNSVGYWKSK